MDREHLLVIGAHAMDAEVMAGGVIAKATNQGHRVMILHLTRGERGHPFKNPEEFAEQLMVEIENAARLLGAEAHWLGYKAAELPLSQEVASKICDIILDFNPTFIITHWRGSWHPRHIITHYNVLLAIAQAASVRKLPLKGLYYGENCEDLFNFSPNIYIHITKENKEQWFQALSQYELFRLSFNSALTKIPYAQYYDALTKIRGLEVGVELAQAFMEERKVYYHLNESPDYLLQTLML